MDAGDVNAAVVATKEVEGIGFLSNGAAEAVSGNLGATRGVQLYIGGVGIGGGVVGRGRGRGLE